MMEHNMLAVSRIYANVRLDTLAKYVLPKTVDSMEVVDTLSPSQEVAKVHRSHGSVSFELLSEGVGGDRHDL